MARSREPPRSRGQVDASQPHATKAPADVPAFELDEVTLAELQKQMARRASAARRQITEAYLGRIAALDRQGPELRSVIETNPEALEIAGGARRGTQSQGRARGPLHGIPVLVKDNVDTADKHDDDRGLARARGLDPGARLARREAAARRGRRDPRQGQPVRVGELPLDAVDLAAGAREAASAATPTRSTATRAARARARASRRRANLAPLAVGTETDGSIVCPSTNCGIVGIKPTVGLVSRAGVIPISHTQDTAGPMARTVADAAALLTALAGADPRDPATSQRGRAARRTTRGARPGRARAARASASRATWPASTPTPTGCSTRRSRR